MLNRGVSGETTRQGLERFPNDLQQYRPDIVTLQFGLNDCNCWVSDGGLPRVSEAAYRANLREMIERARRFGARHIIMSTNHPTLRHKVLLSGESSKTAVAVTTTSFARLPRRAGPSFVISRRRSPNLMTVRCPRCSCLTPITSTSALLVTSTMRGSFSTA